MTARPPLRSLVAAGWAVDGAVLLGLLALAAFLRLPNLAARGPFDVDQGRNMLALEDWLRRGEFPLLGPPASMGEVHHGVLFTYLLAPAAVLGNLDPTAVVAVVAVLGVVAVGLVWHLARAIGGRVAGLVAGLLFAVSASEVGRSTSLWNPGIVPFGSALAAAASWEAWRSRRPGWWLVAGLGAAVALQGHLLSVLAVVPLAGLAVADLRRTRGPGRRRVVAAVAAGLVVVALSYLPLLVHELGSGFAETRALMALATGADGGGERSPWTLFVVGVRVASTSLVGLVTRAPELAILVTVALAGGTAWLALGPASTGGADAGADGAPPDRRLAVRWLGGVILVAIVALWLVAPSLATVVEVLPVDHYHAATDPLVVVLAGILVGRLVGAGRRVVAPPGESSPAESSPARVTDPAGPRGRAVLAGLAVAGLLLWNLATQPPAISPDGGWPAMEAAASRVAASLPNGSLALTRSLPAFVGPDAVTFALHTVGQPAVGPEGASDDEPGAPSLDEPPRPASGFALVVLCDDRFRARLGPPCGGPAEGAWLGSVAWALADRFPVAGGRYVSVYLPTPESARRP